MRPIDKQSHSSGHVRGRPVRGVLLGAAAIVLAAVVALWVYRLDVADIIVVRLLERAGMAPARASVTQIGLGGLQVRDIVAARGAFRIAALAVEFTPGGLVSRRIDRVSIDQPQAVLVSGGNDVTLGGARLPFTEGGGASSSSPVWQVGDVRINQASLALQSGSGSVVAAFSTAFSYGGAASRAHAFALDLSVPMGGQILPVHVEARELAVASGVDGGVQLKFGGVMVASKDSDWAATEAGGEVAWQGGGLSARLDAMTLASARSPPLLVPWAVSGTATMAGPVIDFDFHAKTATASAAFDVKGRHHRDSGIGSATIGSVPLVFKANGLQPRDLMPVLGTKGPVLAGTIGITGSAKWGGGGFAPALTVHLADIAYEPPGARLSRFRGDIRFTGWPLATASGQILRGTVAAGGLPSTEATLVFQVTPKAELHVQGLQMDLAGGQLTATPFVVNPARLGLDTVIGLKNIDVAAFFRLLGVDGLQGTGRLGGTLPLKIADGKIVLSEGHVMSSMPGVLQLRGDALPSQIADAGQSVDLVLQALADFHYDNLAADLVARPDGSGTVALKLKGRNPAVLDGRDFDINVSIETNLDRLVQIALASMQAAQDLLRKTIGSARQ